MTDITAVSAAQRQRLIFDTQQRVRDQQRTDLVQKRQTALSEAQRRDQLVSRQVDFSEQRVRDRRNDIRFETDAARTLSQQQRNLDTVANDTLFQRNQDQILSEVNASRDSREATESRLLRDLEGGPNNPETGLNDPESGLNNAIEGDTLARRRTEDLRQALNDREVRLVERRSSERNEDIQRQLDLSRSLNRIADARQRPERPQDATPGRVLDVRA